MSIKLRLIILTATGVLAALIMGLVSFINNGSTADAISSNQISMRVLRNHLEADMMHDALRSDVLSAQLVSLGKSASSPAQVANDLQEHAQRFRKVLEENLQLATDTKTKDDLNKVKPSLDSYITAAERIVQESLRDPAAGEKLLPAFSSAFSKLEGDMEALSEVLEAHSKQSSKDMRSAMHSANASLAVVLVISLILLISQGIWMIRSIMQPLYLAGRIAAATAQGNLAECFTPPSGQDEASMLLRSLSSMQQDLRGMIESVLANARDVNQASQTLRSGFYTVASSSQQQSDAAGTMAAAASEMTASIEEITRHTEQAQAMATQAEHMAKNGGQVIHQVVADMDGIAQAVQQSAQVIRNLDKESEQIYSIIQVIKGIADQTNLLALNAAIEAARAGEQGRGFAVVADEVRQLAGRTSSSTEEIASMVQRIQQSTREAVSSMEAGVSKVDKGMQVTAEVERAISGILQATLNTSELVNDITRTIGEQSLASNEISHQIESIAGMSQSNNETIRQTANTTDGLGQLASALTHAVERFRL